MFAKLATRLRYLYCYIDQKYKSVELGDQLPPPPLKQTDALWELLFLDGTLMDIIIDNGQIWCKLSALVMVYIH